MNESTRLDIPIIDKIMVKCYYIFLCYEIIMESVGCKGSGMSTEWVVVCMHFQLFLFL